MMSVTISIEPLGKDIDGIIAEMLSPKARSTILAGAAREALAEADAQNQAVLGKKPPHTTTVDGSEGASEDQVRPDGVIVYEFAIIDDLFAWIVGQLQKASPVRSGRFAHSFVLFADGNEIDPNGVIPPASEYAFLNTQPYARKIEAGRSPLVPNGVFEAVAALARAKFGRQQAKISFGYRSLQGGAIGDWAKTASARRLAAHGRGGSAARHTEWLTRSPAIIVTLK